MPRRAELLTRMRWAWLRLPVLQAAITYNQVELRDKCMAFIESNTRDIFKSPHFAELSEQTLAHIIQSDGLTVEEGEIYEAVKEWGTVNMVITEKSMKEVLCNVLQHVRFPMLSQEALKDVEAENAAEPGGEFVPVSAAPAQCRTIPTIAG